MTIGTYNKYTSEYHNGYGLLYIEPSQKPTKRTAEEKQFVTKAEKLFALFVPSTRKCKGHHTCSCGVDSENYELTLPIGPNKKKPNICYVTNSLFLHYLRDHMTEISPDELETIEGLIRSFNIE